MKKIFLSLFIMLTFALQTGANEIAKHANAANFGFKSKNSIYLVDLDNKNVLYNKNEDEILNPASLLKVLTFGAAYSVLGEGYNFETSLYEDSNCDIYLKLGADVLLSQADLNSLMSHLKNMKFNKIYIDDSIFKDENFPKSWLEEDVWPNSRLISPYIIDGNLVKVAIRRSSLSKRVDVIQDDGYKFSFINELKIGESQDIKILRLYGDNSSIVNLQGTVSKDEILVLPVLDPEINFNIKLHYALEKNKIVYLNKISAKKTPQNAKKIACVSHSIEDISKLILHNSQNFASEVVAKAAAYKYFGCEKSASFSDVQQMYQEIYKQYLSEDEAIADSSGVSRENKLKISTLSNISLNLLQNEKFRNLLPTSGDGTMADRLIFLKDNLRAKTGTLREYSSFLTTFSTRKNTNVLLISIVQDSKLRKSLLKNYENTLVGIIYKKY